MYADLVARYSENGRFYHTFDHLIAVLTDVRELPATVQFAAWFHDVIYDPRRSDNEERSAAFAATALRQLTVPQPLIERVAQLIICTQTHQPPPGDEEAMALLDADLAILGAETAVYDRYAAAIRQEYAHVPEEAYRYGRIHILDTFLQRPRLYHTALAYQAHEARARGNLQRERASLQA